jgi:bifunctional ADP-heptose synthase (sugar kinase/adenylyltransferase)
MTAQQKQLKVLLLGDVCRDITHICSSDRKNPESDAPLLKIVDVKTSDGMAANVSKCLKNLGFDVVDILPPIYSTKVRYVDKYTKKQYIRVDSDVPTLYPLTLSDLYYANLNSYDAIVISDYCKGAITEELVQDLIKEFSGPIFIDTKKKDLWFANGYNCIVKINTEEYLNATDVPAGAIITRGEKGATFMDKHYPALKVKAVDVCGAGDAFLAGLVYGWLCGTRPSVHYGIVNAGLSVQYLGTYAPTLEQLQTGMQAYELQLQST